MKYISLAQLRESIRELAPHHPFFATTFLVLKSVHAPTGKKIRFGLDAANREFLVKHYRVNPKSEFFFRVMRQGAPQKEWNEPEYAGKGLQSVNTRGVPGALLHDRNDNTWGWSENYIDALRRKLPRGKPIPIFHLAAWIYKYASWRDGTTREQIVAEFISDFAITKKEIGALFSQEFVSAIDSRTCFQPLPAKWHEILAGVSTPPDVKPESSGKLTFLEIEHVGPSEHVRFEPGSRMSLITGDNGLGKTFLLDLTWWSLTGDWIEREAVPHDVIGGKKPLIKFLVGNEPGVQPATATYLPVPAQWQVKRKSQALSGLVIYARVDGSFAVWDPINQALSGANGEAKWPGLKFTHREIWDGKGTAIDGLIRDWTKWQARPDKYGAFATFQAVLKRVSPPDMAPLEIGEPVRLRFDRREIPTLKHPYGDTPITLESAGIKRIVTLAYLIVWAWEEHKLNAEQLKRPQERQLVVIIDEAEAHLHPRWQRVLLSAILGIVQDLSPELNMQLFVATHSPLVLASAEESFDDLRDRLFHLGLTIGGKVKFDQIPFDIRGGSDSWLMSPAFAISQPGSRNREKAINDAIKLQDAVKPSKAAIHAATLKLQDVLAAEDPFWLRWLIFADAHGIKI